MKTLLNDVMLVGYIYKELMHAAVACVFQAHTLGRGWGKDWGGGGGVVRCKKTRETREGWPLLTVETEVNGDSKRTNESRFVGLVVPVQEIFVLPWLL